MKLATHYNKIEALIEQLEAIDGDSLKQKQTKEAELKEEIKNLGCEAIRKEDGLYIYRNNKLLLLFTNDYMKTHINYWEYAYFIKMIPFLELEVD